jgi:uncharacterized phage-associated protein
MNPRAEIDRLEGQDARGIANFILDLYDPQEFGISNLKINKLIFFLHGFFRSKFDRRLIRNHFEAWDNGPVVRVVFDEFKVNGREPISHKAHIFDHIESKYIEARYDLQSPEEREYLERVLAYYVKFSAGQLVELTHRPGGPWHRARTGDVSARLRDRIPDGWIDDYFVENYGGRKGS